MKKYLLLLPLVLLVAAPVKKAEAVDLHRVGIVPNDAPETQDRSKEDACDCCQKCKAAKSAIKPKHEEGPLETDGCDDCCTKCGKVLQPTQQETPPEIIERKTPPDIIDKSKQ